MPIMFSFLQHLLKKNILILFTLFGCIGFSSLSIAEKMVFEGTIKDIPIVLELDLSESESGTYAYGRYFYQKHKKDIPIEGENIEGVVRLFEGDPKNRLGMIIEELSPKGYGYWFDELKGKTLPLTFKPVSTSMIKPTDSEALKMIGKDSMYTYLRQAPLKFESLASTKFGQYTLLNFKEPRTQFSFFLLAEHPDFKSVNKINALLEYEFRRVLDWFFEMDEIDLKIVPSYLKPEVLSYNIYGSYYASGMPRPQWVNSHVNIHIPSGKTLKFEDIVNLPESVKKEDWILSQLQKIAPNEINDAELSDCDFSNAETWNIDSSWGWYLSEKGLHLSPYFPHVVFSCSEPDWAILPFSILSEYPSLINLDYTHER